ncbi:dfrA [Mangrovimonas yunxiaonensis]|uniref:DfrA n=1 Tax=Mangrovimonas yunxiaonensis TaxID=1197477 RepID=A0A084THK6_9FLAO|nr:Rid family detoxifying hydrolase [Mangrovimonas yunxiaonensis]KFB00192.1 dfrA [Mangrovimonas yunxiaonensis]GGH42441.1 reactive intermediate/imine deaminase [Mangrovimonas yunxiaonensis]
MKRIITTPNAPAPIGPYNQAVLVNGILYTSGQIAINPSTGVLITEDIKTETQQVMENLKAVLTAAGMTFDDVFKATIFVSDMHNFSQVNEVYATYFNESIAPARETVEVANLPKFVNVEISVMATNG